MDIQIDNRIMRCIEKIYVNSIDELLIDDIYISKFSEEIARINGIMSDTKCTFNLNKKIYLYKKVLNNTCLFC